VSELWETESVQTAKDEDQDVESSEHLEKTRPASRGRTAKSSVRSRTGRSNVRSRTAKTINESETPRPTVKVENSLREEGNKEFENTTKPRRPVARRGSQRGRRRRPGQAVKRVQDASVDVASSDHVTESKSKPVDFSRGDISGNIKSPMPPLPRPFVRENQSVEQTSEPKEPTSPSSTDGVVE
jgi:hypothetical protein